MNKKRGRKPFPNAGRTKQLTIRGVPFEQVMEIDPICLHSGLSYSHLMRLVTKEFLARVRHFQEKLDRCEPLEFKHDLARYAALSVHTWDVRPMQQYLENDQKHEDERTTWTWEPEIVTPAQKKGDE